MFELSVACKYLIPRRRQISVSIISLISILVIALVVWLIVVFFSVTDGLEKNWVNKLTTLTAPVRITPTDAYHNSYYYQIDSLSEASGYTHKTIGEKKVASQADPYDPEFDQEIPSFWPPPQRTPEGKVTDLVQDVYQSLDEIKGIPGLAGKDFELTASHIRLRLSRDAPLLYGQNIFGGSTQSILSYPAYLGNFEADNSQFDQILLPVTAADINNIFNLISTKEDTDAEEGGQKQNFAPSVLRQRLESFFQNMTVTGLKARSYGWTIPTNMLPLTAHWNVSVILKDKNVKRIVVPKEVYELGTLKKSLEEQGLIIANGQLFIHDNKLILTLPGQEAMLIDQHVPITLAGGSPLKAELLQSSLDHIKRLSDVKFTVQFSIQGSQLQGTVPYRGLDIGSFLNSKADSNPFWIHRDSSGYTLPKDLDVGEGVLLPKSFKDAGVLLGDRGSLSYYAPTASTLQEHQIPVFVAGFYDPGIIPIGGKFILANQSVASLIRASHQQEDKSAVTNGINVRFSHLSQANEVKSQLLNAFAKKGISRYWNVETYQEYEFTKGIIQELHSQKNIFLLIAVVIIIVACSNIISMLIILVNDKKTEIGILRSMGASTKSIAFIFGFAGAVIGVLGSALGITAALLTLKNMGLLVNFLSALQGYDVFSASFYGEVLPHEISYEALFFVICATIVISLLAGIVPAVKACLLRPSHIFRSSGG